MTWTQVTDSISYDNFNAKRGSSIYVCVCVCVCVVSKDLQMNEMTYWQPMELKIFKCFRISTYHQRHRNR